MPKARLSRMEKLLFVVPLLILPTPFAWHLVNRDSLDNALRELAGPSGIDCGTHNGPAERRRILLGMSKAFRQRQPFFVRENITSTPGASVGLVWTPGGRYYMLSQAKREPLLDRFKVAKISYRQGIAPRLAGDPDLPLIRCKKWVPVNRNDVYAE